jgi:RNA polymerase sigma-70 factor (ECF subfamily)
MSLAREVVQDLFVYLWEHRNELSINISIKSYLYRAVRFNTIRKMENEKKLGIRMDILPEPNEPEFNDHLEYAELQSSILGAIESLPGQCQNIFKLSRFEQLKYSEIAKKLNLSVKTIEAQISKALRMIHQSIDNR